MITARISEGLYNDLRKIAAEPVFEKKLSRVIRMALEEFRDRRRRLPQGSRSPDDPGRSS